MPLRRSRPSSPRAGRAAPAARARVPRAEADPVQAEARRLQESADRSAHWKRWGPYLSDRAWATVREDYSADGNAWEFFPHDHARSRVYRWNEDGLAGICDRHQHICFGLALWNHRDAFLKERLFGLTGLRVTTARTSRSAISIWTARRRTRT